MYFLFVHGSKEILKENPVHHKNPVTQQQTLGCKPHANAFSVYKIIFKNG